MSTKFKAQASSTTCLKHPCYSSISVFDSEISSCPDSASMGAALRSAHGWLCNKKGRFVPISSIYADKLETTSLSCQLAVAGGGGDLLSKYGLLMKKRVEIENGLVQKLGRL